MAMSSFRGKGVIAYINVTPLVDVLLVLLVIFMVTAPMVSQKVKMDLPQASAELPVQSSPQKPIHLKIDQNGQIYWNGVLLDEPGMRARMVVLSRQTNAPVIQIESADKVAYGDVVKVLADAKSYRLGNIGFINVDQSTP